MLLQLEKEPIDRNASVRSGAQRRGQGQCTLLSVAVVKGLDQKQLERKGLFRSPVQSRSIRQGGQSRSSGKNWSRGYGGIRSFNWGPLCFAADRLVLHDLLIMVSYTSQDHTPKDSTAHSELDQSVTKKMAHGLAYRPRTLRCIWLSRFPCKVFRKGEAVLWLI